MKIMSSFLSEDQLIHQSTEKYSGQSRSQPSALHQTAQKEKQTSEVEIVLSYNSKNLLPLISMKS